MLGFAEIDKFPIRCHVLTQKLYLLLCLLPPSSLQEDLCLRMNKARTASMKSVSELSSQFNMTAYETKVALWFLHHHAGVMIYFSLVILDSQVVYNSVTFLILRAMSFNNVGQVCSEKFKETGQFVLKNLVAGIYGSCFRRRPHSPRSL